MAVSHATRIYIPHAMTKISKDDSKNIAQDHEVEKRISQLLTIRSAIHAIANIYNALDGAKSSLLTSLRSVNRMYTSEMTHFFIRISMMTLSTVSFLQLTKISNRM